MKITDTITGIATAAGNSGIGIIRVSGNEAVQIISKIFKPNKEGKEISKVESHTIHYGNIMDKDEIIDEVLLMIMKGPNSYTAEDTVEIDSHGGMLIMKRILELVIKNGARAAEPGEFTKRAFLNGRIDLSQAEAVMEIINAKNKLSLSSAVNQLKGSVSDKIKEIRSEILYHIAFIESALDDPEHISLEGYDEQISKVVLDISVKLKKLVDTFDNGKIVSEGVKTVILGKPNAGKSSLLNLLLGEERAIVTDIEGTTRDTLEEQINFNGISLNIVDTAGIRRTDDTVERLGVDKAKKIANDADLIIFVADGSKRLDENDIEIIDIIKNKRTIILINKSDVDTVIDIDELENISNGEIIEFSAKNGFGLKKLEDTIKEMFYLNQINYNDQLYITNVRHKEALNNAYESMQQVSKSVNAGMPEDFYSIDLMDSYTYLGLIIGESVEEDLVNEIFSKFCTGK